MAKLIHFHFILCYTSRTERKNKEVSEAVLIYFSNFEFSHIQKTNLVVWYISLEILLKVVFYYEILPQLNEWRDDIACKYHILNTHFFIPLSVFWEVFTPIKLCFNTSILLFLH